MCHQIVSFEALLVFTGTVQSNMGAHECMLRQIKCVLLYVVCVVNCFVAGCVLASIVGANVQMVILCCWRCTKQL